MYVLPNFKVDPIKTQFLYWTSFFFLSFFPYISTIYSTLSTQLIPVVFPS